MANHLTLAQEFPWFKFAHEAQKFLQKAKEMNLLQQLYVRKIPNIEFEVLAENEEIRLTPQEGPTGGFFRAEINRTSKPARFMRSFCRIVGHTFGFNIDHNPPTKKPCIQRSDLDKERFEDFVEEFSWQLMAIDSLEKIEADYRAGGDDLAAYSFMKLAEAGKPEKVFAH